MRKLNNITWNNIYYMICFCPDELIYFDEALIDNEDINGTHDLYAMLLCSSFEILIRNGYIRKYTNEEISTTKPYGRLNIAKSIQTGAYNKGQMICNVDKLNINNKINQIIKSTFTILIESNNIIDEKISDKLIAKLKLYKDMLKQVDDININYYILNSKIDIPEWYKPIFAVCRMILNDWLAFDSKGKIRLLELNDQKRLCYIFEKFLRQYIKIRYPNIKVEKRTFKHSNGDPMTPDIIMTDTVNKRILVLDAKWYESEETNKSNLYVLNTYCEVVRDKLGKDFAVSGVDIYASTQKCKINKPRYTDTVGIPHTDAFISVNISREELFSQIDWLIEQSFNINKDTNIIEYNKER